MRRRFPFIALLALTLVSAVSPQTTYRASTSERALRLHIINAPTPAFPIDALKRGKYGVVVASLDLDASGRVADVRILESPTSSMGDSVAKAISSWQFRPFKRKDGQPMRMSGKLTFYFELRGKEGIVLDPSQAGYVGRFPQMELKAR
ncbi:MAG: energy transducer TonB [Candidatus Acidiferrales bacterium]